LGVCVPAQLVIRKDPRMRTPEQIIGHDAHMQLVFEGYEVAHGWQTIDTAPRDGTRFMAFEKSDEYQRYECWWQNDFGHWEGWQDDWDNEPNPTHWKPLDQEPGDIEPTETEQGLAPIPDGYAEA
jgi:hypothetical protein